MELLSQNNLIMRLSHLNHSVGFTTVQFQKNLSYTDKIEQLLIFIMIVLLI